MRNRSFCENSKNKWGGGSGLGGGVRVDVKRSEVFVKIKEKICGGGGRLGGFRLGEGSGWM